MHNNLRFIIDNKNGNKINNKMTEKNKKIIKTQPVTILSTNLHLTTLYNIREHYILYTQIQLLDEMLAIAIMAVVKIIKKKNFLLAYCY